MTSRLDGPRDDGSSGRKREPAPCGEEPLLRIRGLCMRYRRGGQIVDALDGVDLDLAAGQRLALVGASGCGKTTLAHCALRLVEPTSGSVVFAGADLTQMSSRQLRRARRPIQLVFQNPDGALDPRMTAGQSIGEALRTVGVRGERARDAIVALLGEVELPSEAAERFPHQLSGGQKQRICIARALALRPRLLIADEPTSGLDVSVQAQLLALLSGLQRQRGLSLLFISHDLALVRRVADEIAVMQYGRIVERLAADSVDRAAHPHTRELFRAAIAY